MLYERENNCIHSNSLICLGYDMFTPCLTIRFLRIQCYEAAVDKYAFEYIGLLVAGMLIILTHCSRRPILEIEKTVV